MVYVFKQQVKQIKRKTRREIGIQKKKIKNHKVITKETKKRKHTKRRNKESKNKTR